MKEPLFSQLNLIPVTQCLWVVPTGSKRCTATVIALEKHEEGWVEAFPPVAGTIGRDGIAKPGYKREGDGKSPGGIFELGFSFGYAASSTYCWPYRQMHDYDIWIDDQQAPDYNTLTTPSQTTAKSFELMKRKDALYKVGLVVEYNTAPVTPGMGSAIFIHLWRGPREATSGCLALAEKNLRRILAWLQPTAKTVVYFQSSP